MLDVFQAKTANAARVGHAAQPTTVRSVGPRLMLAIALGSTALVSVPAHAEAQFWEQIFRSNRERRARAPRPPVQIYRQPTRPTYLAAPRVAPSARVAKRATPLPTATVEATTEPTPKRPLGGAVGAGIAALPTSQLPLSQVAPAPASEIQTASGVPVLAIVSIADQNISLYGADGLIERSPISSGTAENPTPTGIYGITQKNRWHESNVYSGAEMPFMQRLTWDGVALHEGKLPGYAASHGCIRLPGAFAERLFGMTRSGFRVVIAPEATTPVPITHRMLPNARYWPVPIAESLRPIRTANLAATGAAPLPSPPPTASLDPIAYATNEKASAKAELKPAEVALDRAEAALDVAAKRARATAAVLKSAEKRASTANQRLAELGLAGAAAERPNPVRRDFPNAIADAAEADTQLATTRLADVTARAEVTIARTAQETADQRLEWLKRRVTDMGRRQETASILISRKDKRLYVRQALRPTFDMPVTIRGEDEAIGNHVFVATAPTPGDTALRWLAVSMPYEDRPFRAAKSVPPHERAVARAIRAETAEGALDRIEMSGEVLERLSDYIWAGSSIIITDNGPGHDGVPGHDFAVATKH